MKLFDVYPLMNLELTDAQGSYVYDKSGQKYLDFYGGHAVISIGHKHPHYVERIKDQLDHIAYYSNSVVNNLQIDLADKLGKLSSYDDFQLFLCNSGAEATENALKVASFHTKKDHILTFNKAFHGRTSRALSITDNSKYKPPLDKFSNVVFSEMDIDAVENELKKGTFCAVVIEGIQGLAGIYVPDKTFLKQLREVCTRYGCMLILDEIQSGYGRSGKFFAHQYADIKADLITVAKGMGNGFPIAGVLISPDIEAWYGMCGTTFGGNHLACSAGLAVLEVMENEDLINNSSNIGVELIDQLSAIEVVQEVRGVGLMIGIEFSFPIKALRQALLNNHQILTGVSVNPNVLRLLPPLNIGTDEVNYFIEKLKLSLKEIEVNETIHHA